LLTLEQIRVVFTLDGRLAFALFTQTTNRKASGSPEDSLMDMNLIRPLLRKKKLDSDDWLGILESVRAKVEPKLERMKLKQFADLACIDTREGFYRRIA
jgi:hypothetical protein